MQFATDIHKIEEIVRLLSQARALAAGLFRRADDLESLLSVAESEARRVYAAAIAAGAEPGSIPVILTDDTSEKPEGSE